MQDLMADIKEIKKRIERLEAIERPLTLIGARVYNDAAISIANNTLAALTFNQERYDTDGLHSTSVNTGRLTCTRAGKHMTGTNIIFASNATGVRAVQLRLNGATVIGSAEVQAVNGDATVLNVNCVYDLAVGDYVEVIAYQTSGGNLNISATSNHSPDFWAHRLP